MINQQLINPGSIVVIGGSNDITKPGGKVLKNLLDSNFKGNFYVTNPKESVIQGINCYQNLSDLPQTDLAILAIAAKFCVETVQVLAHQKNTRAFIILSAGFHEESEEGAKLEKQIVDIIDSTGGCLIGPNCIGIMNPNHASVFTTPVPKLQPHGVDFISGSGATAVFIMESGIPKGLTFSSVYSVGNSAQLGVEEVLQYMDEHFDPVNSSKVKLLYIESINKPALLLKHASSLIKKGCRIAAIKSGSSAAGSRAASSHTGALASSDSAVDALFRKAGIVRCYGRDELATVAGIFMHKPLTGRNIAIITHAGGPAVMLTDALSNNGLEVPHIDSPELLNKLLPGSSVANPIDFLATGTAQNLSDIIDYCDKEFDQIDAMVVIFGSPGLTEVFDVYKVLDEKMKTCRKPIFPVLPSVINVSREIDYFIGLGNINFPDEVQFGSALARIYNTPPPSLTSTMPDVDIQKIRRTINEAQDGYLDPGKVQELLDAVGIIRAGEAVVFSAEEAKVAAVKLGFPLVMKVVGPVHKSDVGGVVLNVKDEATVVKEFERMIKIPSTTAILMQSMLTGMQLFAGAKLEPGFGHMVLCGLGGIFIEVLKDVQTALAPVDPEEALSMIRNLRSYKMIQGVRGQEGTSETAFADAVVRLATLVIHAPEIAEMDINPLLGNAKGVIAVDTRIRIER